MQSAVPNPVQMLSSGPVASSPLHKKLLLASVAVVGASAIAVTPVAPNLQARNEIDDRAFQLSAWVNPISTWQNTLGTAAGHLQYGWNAIGTETLPALGRIAQASPAVLQELAGAMTNVQGWQQVFADLPGYAQIVSAGVQGSLEGSQGQGEELASMLQQVGGYLQQGEFTQAFSSFNYWFLFTVGYSGWPLFPVLEIPGDIAETLGAYRTASALDAFLTDNAAGDYTYAILGPPITATFQFTEVLDDVRAASQAGDWETVASDLLNMPAKVLNAYLNGYTPRFTEDYFPPGMEIESWPGLLTNKGTLEAFLFTIPNAISWALNNPTIPTNTAKELNRVTAADVVSSSKLLTVDLESPAAETDSIKTALASVTDTVTAGKTTPVTDSVAGATESPTGHSGVTTEPAGADDLAAGAEVESVSTADKVESGKVKGKATWIDKLKAVKVARADKVKADKVKADKVTKADSDRAESDSAKSETTKADTAAADTAGADTGKSDTGE